MDADKQQAMQALLCQPVLARLGTANPQTGQPHLTLVWFLWDGESIWFSAFSSTRKVRDLEANPRCAVLIEPRDPEGAPLQAVLFEGPCEVIHAPRERVELMSERIYTRYLGPEGVLAPDPQSWLHDPENRIIKLTPAKIYTW